MFRWMLPDGVWNNIPEEGGCILYLSGEISNNQNKPI